SNLQGGQKPMASNKHHGKPVKKPIVAAPLSLIAAASAAPGGTILAYSAARNTSPTYTGPIIRLRRSSDNALLDFSALPSGDVDAAAVLAWAAGADTFVETIYDHSGNDVHVENGDPAQQMQWIASGDGSRPAFVGTGSFYYWNTAKTFNLPSNF